MISKYNILRSLCQPYMKNIHYTNISKFLPNKEIKYICSVPCMYSYSSLSCTQKVYNTKNICFCKINKDKISAFSLPCRSIWGWLNSVFNRVDESRILAAGPDRACAEWLLRCGAGVKWANSENWIKDYNSLPVSASRTLKIEEVDGTNSAVMFIGFPYFRNCQYIRKVIFHKATYLDDDAMQQLHYLKDSLKDLQISSCGNVSRGGLNYIKMLVNLERLLIYDLPLIKDKDEVVKDLQKALPNCSISFPYAHASEIADEKEGT